MWALAVGTAMAQAQPQPLPQPRLSAPATSPASALPTAPVRNVPETFFGTPVDDPYRDFEDIKRPAVAAWMKAHSERAQALLRGISGRAALRDKLGRLDGAAAARVVDVTRLPGELYVYQRRGAGDEQFKLVMRQGLQGKETVVFDPALLNRRPGQPRRAGDQAGNHAINYATPSPDGRLVALGVSAGGSEEASLRVLDMRSGRQLGPAVQRAHFGGVSWLPDSSGFFFHRLQALGKDLPEVEKYQRSMVVFMKPGATEAGLRTVVRAGHDLGIGAAESPLVEVQPDGRALLLAKDGDANELAVWHSTAAALLAGKPDWQKLAGYEDKVTALVLKDDRFYALTHRDAARFKVVGGRLAGAGVAAAPALVPESSRVLTGLAVASDALYVAAREGNMKQLLRRAHRDDAPTEDVALPVLGAFNLGGGSARADLPGVLLEVDSWTRARQIYQVGADGRVANTGLQPNGPYDAPGDVLATEVLVKSHDGALVPMSIIHRADVVLDGNNPTLLYGYASYGITEEPFFSISRLAWMEAGGVFAVANPRGSSVFGQHWHDSGRMATKPNSWRDFIACAEWLVAQKWTQPARLAIWGGSAGGILVGMAMNERPDLFAAVVSEVGALDMVRAETTPNGIPNIAEFGSRTTEPGFRALLAMSTYHQIRDGVKYPAVLFTHGVNDSRVEVWNTTKTAARLLAATASGKPVLMRLDYDSGHGIGDTKSQVLDERADLFAFLLWQFSMPGYALPPARAR
jgi:prolyl oligopeptidase